MPAQRNPTRQRLIHAALELFAVQGVTDTTTRQIAELAEVNEVTLFRHFGNKHGLLLAVIEDAGV
ncbi:MAG TPA: helix-turn-helix domain-containing protein, partial [Thermosynechococcaceae cyanobacterium]